MIRHKKGLNSSAWGEYTKGTPKEKIRIIAKVKQIIYIYIYNN
jgi:hypothetical protein